MSDLVEKMILPGWMINLFEGAEKICSDYKKDAFFYSYEKMQKEGYGPEIATWDIEKMLEKDPSFYSNMANALRNTGNIITTSSIAFHLGDIKINRSLVPDEDDHLIIRYFSDSLDFELKDLHEFNNMMRYGHTQNKEDFTARGVTGHEKGAFAQKMERILNEMVRKRVLHGSAPIPNNETLYKRTIAYARLRKYIDEAVEATKPIFDKVK